jgi:hypothetical protein
MFNDELSKAVEEYQRGGMSLEAFEQWFEENSAMEFADPESNRVRAAVDAALAEYHFDHIEEPAFRRELAAAVRPFARSEPVATLVSTGVYFQARPHRPAVLATVAVTTVAAVGLSLSLSTGSMAQPIGAPFVRGVAPKSNSVPYVLREWVGSAA